MRKITEIYIEKEYMKSGRDAFGNRVKVPTIGKFKRDPVVASQGLRFLHFLIDKIITLAIIYSLAIILAIISYPTLVALATPFFSLNMMYYSLEYDYFSLTIFILYYFITELTMQRSIGKFATGTVVIDEYGNKPSGALLLGRTFSRLIPFDALSCLGERGWHDKISRTYVVKKKEALELRRLLSDPGSMKLSDSDELLD